MMRHDPVLKLNQKPHSLYGIVSFVMAIIALILIVASIMISASPKGMDQSQEILVGILEWVSVMFSIAGFGVAVIGEGAIEMERIFAHVSLLLHFIGIVYHGFVVYFGFIA